VRRPAVFSAVALLLLGATGLLVLRPPEVRPRSLGMPLELLPATLGDWREAGPAPEDVLAGDPQAAQRIARTYRRGQETVWLSVGYYPLQTRGQRPRTQELLLPGSGWTTLETRDVRLPVGLNGAGLDARLVLMETRRHRLAIAHWYQLGPRSIAGEHWYRALVAYNRIVHQRAEGTLVRIATPLDEGGDPATATARLAGFAKALHPALLQAVPQ
jgi:EpsI family protein